MLWESHFQLGFMFPLPGLLVWMSTWFLPAPSLYHIFQAHNFNSWHCISQNGSPPQRPFHLMSPGSSFFRFCFSQGHRQHSRHLVSKSLWEFLKKQSLQLCSGRELKQSIPDWAFWQHWRCSSSVWLNEANSIGFWYETFHWHSWHSVRVIVESDILFQLKGQGRVWKCLQIQSKFSLKEDLNLLKSSAQSLVDFRTWEGFFPSVAFVFVSVEKH